MNRIILYRKLDTDSAETAFQFRIDFFEILCRDVSGVRVQFCQDLWHSLLHEVGHVYGVYILIIYDSQQRIQLVGRTVDDTQTVAGEVLGIKCADKNTGHHADSYDDRRKT